MLQLNNAHIRILSTSVLRNSDLPRRTNSFRSQFSHSFATYSLSTHSVLFASASLGVRFTANHSRPAPVPLRVVGGCLSFRLPDNLQPSLGCLPRTPDSIPFQQHAILFSWESILSWFRLAFSPRTRRASRSAYIDFFWAIVRETKIIVGKSE